jgi:hypothetical protein
LLPNEFTCRDNGQIVLLYVQCRGSAHDAERFDDYAAARRRKFTEAADLGGLFVEKANGDAAKRQCD